MLLIGSILLLGCQPEVAKEAEPEAVSIAAITKLLQDQEDAWNAGDIAGFMEGYWKSDSLRFASGGTIRQGWQETIDRYYTNYPDRAAMGELKFENYEMRRLSPNQATVFGRYNLKREAPHGDATGLYTLMLEKKESGWIIISDHTSAAQ